MAECVTLHLTPEQAAQVEAGLALLLEAQRRLLALEQEKRRPERARSAQVTLKIERLFQR